MAEQKYSHEQKHAVLAAVDRGSTVRAVASNSVVYGSGGRVAVNVATVTV